MSKTYARRLFLLESNQTPVEELRKHGDGSHDDKSHGNWATGEQAPGTGNVVTWNPTMSAPPKDKPITLVFGGSFNPPHLGHVQAVRDAVAYMRAGGYKVTKVYVVPTANKLLANKLGERAYPLAERVEMTRLSFEGVEDVEVTGAPAEEAENFQGKLRRTQLADWAKKINPDSSVVAVTGQDAAPGSPPEQLPAVYSGDPGTAHEGYYYLSMARDEENPNAISSSKIRAAIKEGKPTPKGFMHPAAEAHLSGMFQRHPKIVKLATLFKHAVHDQKDHGNWARGGAESVEFISPNIEENLGWEKVNASFGTARHKAVASMAMAVNEFVGLNGEAETAVGSWGDGRENTVVSTTEDSPDYETVKIAAVMKGLLADQKAVIAFREREAGAASLYSFTVDHDGVLDLAKLSSDLDKLGVVYHTLVPHRTGVNVYIFSPDKAGDADVISAANALKATYLTISRGDGEFIGDTRDPQTRAGARAEYRKEIDRWLEGRGRDQDWEKFHRAWAEKISRVTKSDTLIARFLEFFKEEWDESKHPRGKTGPGTNDGSFAPAGGGSKDEVAEVRAIRQGGSYPSLDRKVVESESPCSTLGSQYDESKPLDEVLKGIAASNPKMVEAVTAALASIENFLSVNGDSWAIANTTPESKAKREAMHAAILLEQKALIDKAVPKDGERPEVILLGGLGGSGKGSFESSEDPYSLHAYTDVSKGGRFYVLDSDKMKSYLPEFQGGVGAALCHREAGLLTEILEDYALKVGANIVIDKTFAADPSRPQKWQDRVRNYKDGPKNYTVRALYMHAPRELTVERVIDRWWKDGKANGRLVPPKIPYESRGNEGAFDSILGLVDDWEIYSSDAPRHTKARLVVSKRMWKGKS